MGIETQVHEIQEEMAKMSWTEKPVSNKTGGIMTGSLLASLIGLAFAGGQQLTTIQKDVEANKESIEAHVIGADHADARIDHDKIIMLEKDLGFIRENANRIETTQAEIKALIKHNAEVMESDYNRRMDKLEKLLQDNLAKSGRQ